MAKWDGFQGALSEVERLRVELERARELQREMALDMIAAYAEAEQAHKAQLAAEARADRLQAERDDLAARLQSIQQAERKYTAAKLHEAARMRKGEAL